MAEGRAEGGGVWSVGDGEGWALGVHSVNW